MQQYFHSKVKEDTLDILFRSEVCLKEKDISTLSTISDRTIHNASVFQDHLSVDIAVLIYALSKVLAQKTELCEEFQHTLNHARSLLLHDQVHSYEAVIHETLLKVQKINTDMKRHVAQVIEQAQIKKGSRLYYHGISLGQSASVMGISQWELYNYVGKTTINDDGSDSVQNLKKRLDYARSLFASNAKDKSLVFDAGPIITITMNHIMPLLPKIKQLFKGDFMLPHAVMDELVSKPLQTKEHKIEVFQVLPMIGNGTLHVVDKELVVVKAKQLQQICNTTYFAFGNPIHIIHDGEIEAVALVKLSGAAALVVDERTMRYLIETPSKVVHRLEAKLHTSVTVNKENLQIIKKEFEGIHTLRSVELLIAAFELGLFDKEIEASHLENAKKEFLSALLWGLKMSGCAVTNEEVFSLLEMQE